MSLSILQFLCELAIIIITIIIIIIIIICIIIIYYYCYLLLFIIIIVIILLLLFIVNPYTQYFVSDSIYSASSVIRTPLDKLPKKKFR